MSKSPPAKIPSEDIEDCQPWPIPQWDEQDNVLPSAEIEDREREAENADETGEIIEIEAENLQPLTAEMLEEITRNAQTEGRTQGYEDGLQQGLSEGREKGMQQGREEAYRELSAELEQQQVYFSTLADALFLPIQKQDSALEKLMVDMVQQLCCSIIKRELRCDEKQIATVISQGLAELPAGAKNISVYVHPDDLSLIEKSTRESKENSRENKPYFSYGNWSFKPDPLLTHGGYRIETDTSLIDFSLEHRIETLFQQFFVEPADQNPVAESPSPSFQHEEQAADSIPPREPESAENAPADHEPQCSESADNRFQDSVSQDSISQDNTSQDGASQDNVFQENVSHNSVSQNNTSQDSTSQDNDL